MLPFKKRQGADNEWSRALADAAAREARLARANAELGLVFAAIRDGVLALDGGGHVTQVNPAAAAILGREAGDLAGRPLIEVLRTPAVQQVAAAAIAGRSGHIEADFLVPGADGRLARHFFELSATPIPGRAGAVLVLHDITRQRRLDEVRRDFVANASHEIRTPITAIKMASESLADRPPEEVRRRMEEIIARQADRLHALIEDMLALSDFERGLEAVADQRERVAADTLLAQAVEAVAPQALARGVSIRVQAQPGLVLQVRREAVLRALVNLLSNAVKYGGHSVEAGAAAGAGEALLTVRDDGPGIPEEHQSRLFERFYRTDNDRSRDTGGTGLGLAIVKHVAEAHGGRVRLESRLGHGAAFHIHLPNA